VSAGLMGEGGGEGKVEGTGYRKKVGGDFQLGKKEQPGPSLFYTQDRFKGREGATRSVPVSGSGNQESGN